MKAAGGQVFVQRSFKHIIDLLKRRLSPASQQRSEGVQAGGSAEDGQHHCSDDDYETSQIHNDLFYFLKIISKPGMVSYGFSCVEVSSRPENNTSWNKPNRGPIGELFDSALGGSRRLILHVDDCYLQADSGVLLSAEEHKRKVVSS